MTPLDLTKTALTPQESEDIRNEVERFEVLYQERYGDHEDLDAYIRELYYRYFNVDDAQALRFVDTKAFKEELEYWGWCFTPSLDGTMFFAFND